MSIMADLLGNVFNWRTFNCAHLAAKWFLSEYGADIPVPEWKELKTWNAEQIHKHLLQHGFVDIQLNEPYQKGDGILYDLGNGATGGGACITDKIALVFDHKSKLIHIDKINNKLYHIRYVGKIND